MWLCIAFLVVSTIHVTKHIISWRKGKAHSHEVGQDANAKVQADDDTTKDAVGQAEDVLDAALEGLVIPPTQTDGKGVS
jgi:hypothetical protein